MDGGSFGGVEADQVRRDRLGQLSLVRDEAEVVLQLITQTQFASNRNDVEVRTACPRTMPVTGQECVLLQVWSLYFYEYPEAPQCLFGARMQTPKRTSA